VLALGGNAILKPEDKGTTQKQLSRVRSSARQLVRIIERGDRILLTHGNGPQVGDILLKNEMAKDISPPMPLDVCVAESQGMIGYMLQQALGESLASAGIEMPVITVLTQVLVDPTDTAFRYPTKPIGRFYTSREASDLMKNRKWRMALEKGRGYRRIVPSPLPVDILEMNIIGSLFRAGTLVIAAGGGGIPVVRGKDGKLRGVEAVLDKDLTAALLGTFLKADVLLILTDVDRVYLDYKGPAERPLDILDLPTAERYLGEGQFPVGTMRPKIESALNFLKSGGQRVVIAPIEQAEEALAGKAGTTVIPKL
jgi:carbamate kinase